MTRAYRVFIMVAVATLAARGVSAQRAEEFKVIVHAGNPISSVSQGQVAGLFLKRETRWRNGVEVVPVDLPETSQTRRTFSKAMLRRSADAIKDHWNRQIFSGRGVPPLQLASEREIVEFVGSNPGAVGYVSPSTPLGPECKVVEIIIGGSE